MSLFDANWEIQVEKLLPPIVRSADFIERNDDFKAGEAQNQFIHYLVVSAPGHWKEFPTIGAAVIQFLAATVPAATIQRAIRVQLTNDVFPNPLVDATGFPVIIINDVVVEIAA